MENVRREMSNVKCETDAKKYLNEYRICSVRQNLNFAEVYLLQQLIKICYLPSHVLRLPFHV